MLLNTNTPIFGQALLCNCHSACFPYITAILYFLHVLSVYEKKQNPELDTAKLEL